MDNELKTALNELHDNLESKQNIALKEQQDHLNHLDAKVQGLTKGGFKGGKNDELKSLITKNFDKIKTVGSSSVEIKAPMLLTTNLTGDANREYQPTVSMIPGQPINFEQLVSTIPISVGIFTYPRETAITGVVATQTEGSDKSELSYDLSMIDVATEFLAGYCRFSKKMSNNLPYLEGYLPMALRRDYFKAENSQFFTTLSGLATASSLLVGNEVERIVNDATTLMNLNFFPNIVVVNPSDYGKILLTAGPTGSDTSYSLPGVVTISNGMVQINGINVVVATWVPADKYILGDWSYCQKILTEGLNIRFFEQDQDNVIKNLITARVEAQIGLAVQNPTAFIYGDFTTIA